MTLRLVYKALLFILLIMLLSCGFRIKKQSQQYPLLFGYQSLYLDQIENTTYQPQLVQQFRFELQRAMQNKISANFLDAKNADVVLKIRLVNYKEQSQENVNQSDQRFYQFDFSIIAQLIYRAHTNKRANDASFDIQPNYEKTLIANYQLESSSPILDQARIKTAQYALARTLAKAVVEAITITF